MERIGEIISARGNRLVVQFCRGDECGSCHACEGGQKTTEVTVFGQGAVGDYAAIQMPTSTVVKASLLAYIVPLCAFFLGMLLGQLILPANPNLGAAVGGILFLAVAWGIITLGERKRRNDPRWHPVLIRVIPRDLRDHPKKD
ncbi:MAG: SoxR reducing system RseC family protein [Clostridia bacterium]|nr:SoxR reducing system RseC family protein [Clostridia bacterium]